MAKPAASTSRCLVPARPQLGQASAQVEQVFLQVGQEILLAVHNAQRVGQDFLQVGHLAPQLGQANSQVGQAFPQVGQEIQLAEHDAQRLGQDFP